MWSRIWVNLRRDLNWKELGFTEYIGDNSDPIFNTPIETKFIFGQVQNLKFTVYDMIDL